MVGPAHTEERPWAYRSSRSFCAPVEQDVPIASLRMFSMQREAMDVFETGEYCTVEEGARVQESVSWGASSLFFFLLRVRVQGCCAALPIAVEEKMQRSSGLVAKAMRCACERDAGQEGARRVQELRRARDRVWRLQPFGVPHGLASQPAWRTIRAKCQLSARRRRKSTRGLRTRHSQGRWSKILLPRERPPKPSKQKNALYRHPFSS